MKKIRVILSVALIASMLFGCSIFGKEDQQDEKAKADEYIEIGMDHYLDGEYDLAISILEKGFEETKDARIADYIYRIKSISNNAIQTEPSQDSNDTQSENADATQPQQDQSADLIPIVQNPDYTRYNGRWGNAGELRIQAEGDKIEIELTVGPNGWNRIATIHEVVSVSQVKDGALWIPCVDSWGNSCVLTIAFFGNKIIYTVRDVVRAEGALWGVYECAVTATLFAGTGIGLNAEPAAEGVLAGYTADKRMLVNIFLSNFSEQNFEKYPAVDFYLIKYAIAHCQINIANNLFKQGNLTKISKANVDNLLNLYFGKTVQAQEGTTYFDDNNQESISFSGGAFGYVLNEAPDSNYFSVATYMADNGDGTYTVKFNTYHLDDSKYGYSIYPYYGLSDAEARTRSELNFAYSGSAVVKASKKADGSAFYQLVSYSKD